MTAQEFREAKEEGERRAQLLSRTVTEVLDDFLDGADTEEYYRKRGFVLDPTVVPRSGRNV